MTRSEIIEQELARPDLVVRCRNAEHGDYQTAIALRLGKRLGIDPRLLAEQIVARLNAK